MRTLTKEEEDLVLREISMDIQQLIKDGGVVTEKNLYTEGLVTVYSDENCKITCTTTYQANHHFFDGKTTWCTASDENGKYDGWEYFQSYCNFNNRKANSALFQVMINGDSNSPYQAQVSLSGVFQLVCDKYDHTVKENNVFSENIINIIKNNVSAMCDEITKMHVKELSYKNRNMSKEERMYQRMVNQVNAFNDEKKERITREFDYATENKLFSNTKFINMVLENTGSINHLINTNYTDYYHHNPELINQLEAILQESHYFISWGMDGFPQSGDNIACVKLRQAIGTRKIFDTDGIITTFTTDRGGDLVVYVMCLMDEKYENVKTVLGNLGTYDLVHLPKINLLSVYFKPNYDRNEKQAPSYMHDYILIDDFSSSKIMSLRNSSKYIDIDKRIIAITPSGDNEAWLFTGEKILSSSGRRSSRYNTRYTINFDTFEVIDVKDYISDDYCDVILVNDRKTLKVGAILNKIPKHVFESELSYDLRKEIFSFRANHTRDGRFYVILLNESEYDDIAILFPEGKVILKNKHIIRYTEDKIGYYEKDMANRFEYDIMTGKVEKFDLA